MKTNHSHTRENARRRRQIERGIIKVTQLILFLCLFISSSSLASETTVAPVKEIPTIISSYDIERDRIPTMSVVVEVEAPGKFWNFYTTLMPRGSTPYDALVSGRHKVVRGRVCADDKGVLSIDGVKDYWMVSVNGDYQNVNAHTILRSGDRVKWQHVSARRNPDHI